MNKILPSCIIVLFMFTSSQAQVEIKPGIKGGINIASLSNLETRDAESKSLTSFHLGATLSFKFADFYTLQPEILYSRQGSKVTLIAEDDKFNVQLSYLSIPVNSKFFVGNTGLNFQIAPVLDILLDYKNVDNPDSFDLAIVGGVGFDMENGISFSLAYKQGIIDLFGRNIDNGGGYENTNVSDLILNNVLQLSMGYQFDF